MNHDSYSGYSHGSTLSHLVEKACRHWEARRQASAAQRDLSPKTPLPCTIALAREAGTQGTSVAKEVGTQLGWQVYDHELLEQVANDMGLRASLVESVDERRQSWLAGAFKDFMSVNVVSDLAYVHHLVKTVLALGTHGECVIVGRGVAFILPPETTLRVRLVAPLQERIATLSRLLSISEREAAGQVRTIDRERTGFVREHFDRDPSDPRNYDLVLNVSRFSVPMSARLVIEALHQFQARRQ